MAIKQKKLEIGGRELIFETGHFAEQANAAVTCCYGGTVVLAAVVAAPCREEIDYFPLYVEYQEKLYAGGKIKGSRWVKREGRPSDEAILTARLIDRSLRPLFPKDYKNEVQVVVTVLSVDGENDPEIPGILAASAALAISDIPWDGPVGAIRVGNKTSTFFANPTYGDLDFSDMNIIAAATEDSLIMLEGEAREVSRELVTQALEFSHQEIKKIVKAIKEFQKEAGRKKQALKPAIVDQKIKQAVQKEIKAHFESFRDGTVDFDEFKAALAEKMADKKAAIFAEELFFEAIREEILTKKIRFDGRKADEIRKITIETGILPRTHGSAMFKRGKTQALTITTLGSPSLEQLVESMTGEETKRYMHHYYMPPYSVGETGRFGWPSRREVGHGTLAERALEPVLPSEEEFPYTIRVVSELMSSNGSTSMASVCGSTLSLMDAGVPIKKPVAGIALGLIKNEKSHVVLTDISGLEDHCGDMDCKIAGSQDGITALQMDVKSPLPLNLIEEIFEQADQGRAFILEKMIKAMPKSRTAISQYAPKVAVIKIEAEKIGEVIGPGGRMIRQIISETGAAVDVKDSGEVTISGPQEGVKKASEWVKNLVREVKIGETFSAEVKRIQPFGAFVEILPGKEGLVHVSKMANRFIKDPSEVVSLGDKVQVKVVEIDERKRINLSMILDEKPGERHFSGRGDQQRRPFPQNRSRYPSRQSSRSGDRPPFRSQRFPRPRSDFRSRER